MTFGAIPTIPQILTNLASSGQVFPAGVIGGLILIIIFSLIMVKIKVPMPFALMTGFLLMFGLSAVTGDIFTSLYYLVGAIGFAMFGFLFGGILKRF